MSFWGAELGVALGVVLSIVIPGLAKGVKDSFSSTKSFKKKRGIFFLSTIFQALRFFWPSIRPYAKLAILSLAVAVVLVAFLGKNLTTWESAIIAGYMWDSTLQKITGKP